jgi:hypothetical protein
MENTTEVPTYTCSGCGKVYDARYFVICCVRVESPSGVGFQVSAETARCNVEVDPVAARRP